MSKYSVDLPPEVVRAIETGIEEEVGKKFGFDDPLAMLRKLLWNRDKVLACTPSRSFEQPFLVMDFIVTAWHMHEWVFHRATDDKRRHWEAIFKSKMRDEKDFGRLLCERIPELNACSSIANALKHCDRHKPDLSGVYAWINSEHSERFDEPNSKWTARIYVDGEVIDGAAFCERVSTQWTILLAQLEMIPEPIGEEIRVAFQGTINRQRYPFTYGSWTWVPYTIMLDGVIVTRAFAR